MEPASETLLQKCQELIEMLRAHEDHSKLRALRKDVEALRDRLLAEPDKTLPATDAEAQRR